MPTPTPDPAPKPGKYSTYRKDVKLGRGQSLRFTKGKGYYAARTGSAYGRGAGSDYIKGYEGTFAPMPRAAIFDYANQLYGRPTSQAALRGEASRNVNSSLSPLINQINRSFAARAAQGAKAITGYTNAFAGRLGQLDDQMIAQNQQVAQQQAGLDAALADYVRNQGASLSDSLGATFSQMGAPQAEQSADVAAALAQGASSAVAGLGASTLSRLLAQGQADVNYAQKLPGLATMQGRNTLGAFQADLTRQQTESIGELRSQIPGMINDAYNALQSRELARQQGRAGTVDQLMSRNLQAAIAAAGFNQNADATNRQYEYQWWNATEGPAGQAAAARGKPKGKTLKPVEDRVAENWESWTNFANNVKDVVGTDPFGNQVVTSTLGFQQLQKRLVPMIMRTAGIKNRNLATRYAAEVLASLGIFPKPKAAAPGPALGPVPGSVTEDPWNPYPNFGFP